MRDDSVLPVLVFSAVAVLLLSIILVSGCLDLFGKRDAKTILIESAKKTNALKSAETNYKITFSVMGTTMNMNAKMWQKGNNTRVDISGSYLGTSMDARTYSFDNKTYSCSKSLSKWECIEGEDSGGTGAFSKPLDVAGGADYEGNLEELIEGGVITLSSDIAEKTVSGRRCDSIQIVIHTENISKMAGGAADESELVKAAESFEEYNVKEIIFSQCLDRETGMPLEFAMGMNMSASLYGGQEFTINMTATEFKPNIEIQDSVFALPSQPIVECYDWEKTDEEINKCYIDTVGTDVGMCETRFYYSEVTDCVKAVYNKTQDRNVCDKINDSDIKDSCIEGIAGMLGDADACRKIEDSYYMNSCLVTVAGVTKNISLCNEVGELYSDDCYGVVAIETSNSSICNMIEDDYSKSYCKQATGGIPLGENKGVDTITSSSGSSTENAFTMEKLVSEWSMYKIVATKDYAAFYVNGELAYNHTEDIPKGELNLYFATSSDYGLGNTFLSVDYVKVNGVMFDDFGSGLEKWNTIIGENGKKGHVDMYNMSDGRTVVSLGSGDGVEEETALYSKQKYYLSDTPLTVEFSVSAYEDGGGRVYGDNQPRGLRVGIDSDNAIEFVSYYYAVGYGYG